jgi:type I restriction-modification system DNA methylase subunit
LGEQTPLEPVKVDRRLIQLFLDEDDQTIYESRSLGIRKIGEVCTPASLVREILDLAGYNDDIDPERARLIDASCGFGSFMEVSVLRLRNALIKRGLNPDKANDAREIIRNIETRIAGIELNPAVARRAVVSYLKPLRELILIVRIVDPQYFPRPSIYEYDALSENLIPNTPFDFAVGNPPYVRNRDLPKRYGKRTGRYSAATGRFDEYVLFFERAMNWLGEGGCIAYITPDRYLTSGYGAGLRNLLLNSTRISWLVKLPEKTFGLVNTYPMITIATNSMQARVRL